MSSKKPMLMLFAGPNGSGKSTIKEYFDTVGTYTNADDIVASTGMDNLEAAQFVDESRYSSIAQKQDFTFETVLSSEHKLKILRKAKAEGYFIKCAYVLTISPDINIARVKARVANGGHGVPNDKIVSRYYKSLENLKELYNLCDILHVYDNTVSINRIIRKHKESTTFYPNEIWDNEAIKNLII